MLKLRKAEILIAVIPIILFMIGIFFSNQLPEQITTHWDAEGNVNGHMEKTAGVFLIPFITMLTGALFIAIPRIDPLRKNIFDFRRSYEGLAILFMLFMCIIFAQMILWNIGIRLNPSFTVPLGSGVLFIYIGLIMGKVKRNWFIGIRTPWTLESDVVWGKTHRLGGKLFMICGIFALTGSFLPRYTLFLLVGPILLSTVALFAYSYFEYRKFSSS